jgi:hypothetical protein
MSLKQRLSSFFDRTFDAMATHFLPAIVLFMVVPSLLITFFSARYLTSQFRESRDKYLQATLAVALSEMEQRQLDIRRTAAILAGEPDTQRALLTGNAASLVRQDRPVPAAVRQGRLHRHPGPEQPHCGAFQPEPALPRRRHPVGAQPHGTVGAAGHYVERNHALDGFVCRRQPGLR